VSTDGRTAVFQVLPEEGPASESTEDLVRTLRASSDSIEDQTGVSVSVTGQTAANIDVSARLMEAMPLYLGIVVGLSLILLLLVFRSVLVPLIATAGFLLSLLASFGATVAIYQWGWFGDLFGVTNPGPILSFLPIILIGVLFGLAMDYQMFLVSGMREAYVHGGSARAAVRVGFSHGARVVTAAAIIMVSVFAGFVFSHLTMVRPIGFGLAFGVLLDAFVVRMTLVPAAMYLLGRKAWWLPRWLDRILPDVDVEGAKLTTRPEPQREAVPAAG
jgi:RND superfamily putative drug exporter